MTALPANLPDVEEAQLPAVYESAKQALANCDQIDECKEWADKAAALASYAKQADDETLMNHAKRIKVRAIRRAGQLLKAMEPSKGGQPTRGGDSPSRKKAARDAGMSPDQQKQAQRVASVPEDEFDAQVESDSPPTVTALAEQGKGPSPFSYEQVRAAKATTTLESIFRSIEQYETDFTSDEIQEISESRVAERLSHAICFLREVESCIHRKT